MALDVWVPVPLAGERERDARHFQAIVRLKPGVSVSEANAEAATVAARLARGFPKTNQGDRRPDRTDLEGAGGGRRALWHGRWPSSVRRVDSCC